MHAYSMFYQICSPFLPSSPILPSLYLPNQLALILLDPLNPLPDTCIYICVASETGVQVTSQEQQPRRKLIPPLSPAINCHQSFS